MSQEDIHLDRVKSAEQALKMGRALLEEGKQFHRQAQSDETAKRWKAALANYHKARTTLASAADELRLPTGLGESSYKAVQSIRSDAQVAAKQAAEAIELLDNTRGAERCENILGEATNLLGAASAALVEGYNASSRSLARDHYRSARELAEQAREKDPSLSEQAERIIREAEDFQNDGLSPLRISAMAGVLTLFMLLLWLGWQYLWPLIENLLFPAATVLLTFTR